MVPLSDYKHFNRISLSALAASFPSTSEQVHYKSCSRQGAKKKKQTGELE